MAAVRLPARLAGGKVLVRIGDTPIMLFAKLVVRRIRVRIAPQPELLDEGIPLLIVAQAHEGFSLFIGDDPDHILVQPGLVGLREFLLQLFLALELLLVGKPPLERIGIVRLVQLLPRSILRAVLTCVLRRPLTGIARGSSGGCRGPSLRCRRLLQFTSQGPARRARKGQQANSNSEYRPISWRHASDRLLSLLHRVVQLLQSPILRSRRGRGKDGSAYWTFIRKKGHLYRHFARLQDSTPDSLPRSLFLYLLSRLSGNPPPFLCVHCERRLPYHLQAMKKVIGIILAVLVVAGLVSFMIYKAQSGYTSVLTGKVVRQDLATVVSGTGQIRPKTFVNLGAMMMGRVTHFYVKEGDHVKKGEVVATIENVQQEAAVDAQTATIDAAKTDINSYIAAEKTAEANVEHAKADLEQKDLDYKRAQGLYKDGIMAKQDFDAKKAAYDTDVASVAQAVAGLNQSRAQTDSARGHMETQIATQRANEDMLSRTYITAPFDGIVTNEPIRQGETVVEGIQNAEGSTLMTLADMSVITAEVKVDETDIVNIEIGQPADVTVDALPGRVFKGHVTAVGDQALLRTTGIATSQSTTGTEEAKDFKVVVTLDQTADDLRPGLSTTAKITTAHKPSVLTLPIQALVQRDVAKEEALAANAGKPV